MNKLLADIYANPGRHIGYTITFNGAAATGTATTPPPDSVDVVVLRGPVGGDGSGSIPVFQGTLTKTEYQQLMADAAALKIS